MQRSLPAALMRELATLVETARAEHGIVNIPELAEQLRQRHERLNIALEDIGEMVMRQAQLLGAPMEFYSPVLRQ